MQEQLENRRMAHLIAERAAPKVVYDVGASNGAWTLDVLEVFPQARFELFEPLHRLAPGYSEFDNLLNQHAARIRIHEIAIGSSNEDVKFHVTSDSVSSTAIKWHAAEALAHTINVPMRSIDSLISDDGYPIPDLVKMDIQGGELTALRGATRFLPKIGYLILETWFQRGYGPETPLLHEITLYLERFGFEVFDIGHSFRSNDGRAYAVDVCFWKP